MNANTKKCIGCGVEFSGSRCWECGAAVAGRKAAKTSPAKRAAAIAAYNAAQDAKMDAARAEARAEYEAAVAYCARKDAELAKKAAELAAK